MTKLLPPAAAAAVAEAKPSAMTTSGPEGWAMWTWLSIPPGSTQRPVASISSAASPTRSAMATIRPPEIPISA